MDKTESTEFSASSDSESSNCKGLSNKLFESAYKELGGAALYSKSIKETDNAVDKLRKADSYENEMNNTNGIISSDLKRILPPLLVYSAELTISPNLKPEINSSVSGDHRKPEGNGVQEGNSKNPDSKALNDSSQLLKADRIEKLAGADSLENKVIPAEISRSILVDEGKLDLSELWGESRLMEIGDAGGGHDKGGAKEELIKHIAELKNAGVTSIGFEFLPQDWEKMSRKELTELLIKTAPLGDPNDKTSKSKETGVNEYLKMIDAALEAGIKPVGLELGSLNREEVGKVLKEVVSEPEGKKAFDDYADNKPGAREALEKYLKDNGISFETLETDASKFMDHLDMMKETGYKFSALKNVSLGDFANSYGLLSEIDWRNEVFAKKIEDTLKNSTGRMAIFAGFGHFTPGDGKHEALNDLLDKKYKPVVIALANTSEPPKEGNVPYDGTYWYHLK